MWSSGIYLFLFLALLVFCFALLLTMLGIQGSTLASANIELRPNTSVLTFHEIKYKEEHEGALFFLPLSYLIEQTSGLLCKKKIPGSDEQ